MARVRFIGDGEACAVFGATFRRNRWTAGHGLSEDAVAVLSGNPVFEVDRREAPADEDSAVDGGEDAAPTPDPDPDPEV